MGEIESSQLRADCSKCFGLCCVALYFSASEGFPEDKAGGQPCRKLLHDFRCKVHTDLKELGYKGCLAFDCFGAGQKVSQASYNGQDWRGKPESTDSMYKAFLIMCQLHELLWYLSNALQIESAETIYDELASATHEAEKLTQLPPELLFKLDVVKHRARVDFLLIETSELVRKEYALAKESIAKETVNKQNVNTKLAKKLHRGADLIGADLKEVDLRGAHLRGAYLIAADLRGADLSGTDLIGADFRDADIRGANLRYSIFLTQGQVNAARGDCNTSLPTSIVHPAHW